MNHWLRFLADLPATGQRQIARFQRISLPRGCPAETRLQRLRQALCHAATVRSSYFLLDPALQDALQDLRTRRGGMALSELEQRYGRLRPWSQIATQLQPQSITEELVLRGWLLPRPATPHHPQRFLLPPELRRWLPQPLALPILDRPVPALGAQPAGLQVALALLLLGVAQPLTLAGTQLNATSLRRVAQSCPKIDRAGLRQMVRFVLPLLLDLGLLSVAQGQVQPTVVVERFLDRSTTDQLLQLRKAWLAATQPDAWIRPLLIDQRGIDWPLLRWRLLRWAEALPAGQMVSSTNLYESYAAAFGPLANAQTHGFRGVDRSPWQPRRAAAIWHAALHGPLCWLGVVETGGDGTVWSCGAGKLWSGGAGKLCGSGDEAMETCGAVELGSCGAVEVSRCGNGEVEPCGAVEVSRCGDGEVSNQQPDNSTVRQINTATTPQPHSPPTPYSHHITAQQPHQAGWHLDAPGTIHIPHAAIGRDGVRLAHWMAACQCDAQGMTIQISAASRAQATQSGLDDSQLALLLERQTGVLPDAWQDWLDPRPALRLEAGLVLTAEHPALLDALADQRSVRRHGLTRLAPGIALLPADARLAFAQRCVRQGIPLEDAAPQPDVRSAESLSPGESAALLLACTFYRQHAPVDAPMLPTHQTEQRLAAGLTPALRRTLEPVLEELRSNRMCGDVELPQYRSGEMGSNEAVEMSRCGAVEMPRCRDGETTPQPDNFTTPQPNRPTAHAILYQAIVRRATLRIGYSAEYGQQSERIIRPLLLEQRPTGTYLRAYCLLRRAERTFRLDRIHWIMEHGVELWRCGAGDREKCGSVEMGRWGDGEIESSLNTHTTPQLHSPTAP